MMTFVTSVMLAALACLNYAIARSVLYPPVLFTGIWSLLLFALAISGNIYYPLSTLTLVIYFTGALAMSTGGMTTLTLTGMTKSSPHPESDQPACKSAFTGMVLNLFLAAQIIFGPLYFNHLKELSSLANVDNFLLGIRLLTSSGIKEDVGFGNFAYLVSLMSFLALIAVYEQDGSKFKTIRAWLYILLAMGYQILTAARTGSVLLLVSLLIIMTVKAKTFHFRNIALGLVVFVTLFTVPALYLGKGGSTGLSLTNNIESIATSMRDYTLPSLVAFDSVVSEDHGIGKSNSTLRSLFAIANSLGARYGLESVGLDYSYTPVPTNIYTIYYHYYRDYGLPGTLLILFLIGTLSTLVFIMATGGNKQAAILFSLIAASLLISNIGDPFMSSFSFWIQAIAVTFFTCSSTLNNTLDRLSALRQTMARGL